MRAVEVLDNLKGFVGWEYSSYHMSKEEADVCIEALKVLINLDKLTEGKEKVIIRDSLGGKRNDCKRID